MKNKITFFRFANSQIAFDSVSIEELRKKQALEDLDKLKQKIQSLKILTLHDENESLRSDNELLDSYIDFKSNYMKDKGFYNFYQISNASTEKIGYDPYSRDSLKECIEKSRLQGDLIEELKAKSTQKSLKIAIDKESETEKELETAINNGEYDVHNRVEAKDIINLNREIEKMNTEGWQVKQIQNIESGKYDSWSDGGYGYSFTEGILIVWEKKD